MDNKNTSNRDRIAFLFLIIPTITLILGYFIYPYPPSDTAENLIMIPMFLAPILLGIGYFIKKEEISNKIKIIGWMIFVIYWSTQPAKLYISEGGDVFNAAVCIIGVYILSYLAYQEWLSLRRVEKIGCLNWIAGASAIAGIIYFGVERTVLAPWLVEETARESTFVINLLIGHAEVEGTNIFLDGKYAVTIIFACTAIQAMVIFIGMIGALPKVDVKRKIYGFLITLVPIYFLNLLRNAMVVFLVGREITDFNIAHNLLSKTGALVTLIVLLVIVIKIIPEIFDEIICLTELYKRNGPLEQSFKRIWRKK